jgi:deoxyribonuclease-4
LKPPAPVGAHVSVAGGTPSAGPRAAAIGAHAIQIFTKNANQWRERVVEKDEAKAFRAAMKACNAQFVTAHDSYLINLASPDPALRGRSFESFVMELERCTALRLDALVSHPGNYMDDRAAGLERNAEAISRALERVPGKVRLLIEGTAGAGTSLGSTFEELAGIRALIPAKLRRRVGVCLDTCHLHVAGYDLVNDFEGVWKRFAEVLSFPLLGCLHLNDTRSALGSHLDRHEEIGKGALGAGVFRKIMMDPRLRHVPRIIETPKGDDEIRNDRRAIRLLRKLQNGG